MGSFILPIFPEASLATSIITTVWVGLFVVCFFNLRFGWNLSGLIVPGYLVPLLILKPWSGVANIIEAIITYFIVRLFSEFGSRTGWWSNVFGRDRFFCILVFAAVVRIICDLYLFPELTAFSGSYFNINFVYRGGLYSIGLVIVALIANQFWNQGIKRGLPHFAIIIAISYILIQYVLVRFTNFRLSEVAFLYEGIAQSVVASPKAYIILLTAAFLASRMNLLYGWEFSGIIIPALLALEWYYPWKIATSVVEAFIIYGIAILILKLPIFRNITIEGARKILLFFNISFAYKMLIGFSAPLIFSDINVTDYYGLGYMLTSLIAIKMYDKKLGVRMVGITLETSLKAVIIATLAGFFIFYLPFSQLFNTGKVQNLHKAVTAPEKEQRTKLDLIDSALKEQLKLYHISKEEPTTSGLLNRTNFVEALYAVKNYIRHGKSSSLSFASNMLKSIGFNIANIDSKYIYIYDILPNSFRGIFAFSLNPEINHTLVVLHPRQNPGLLAAALGMFEKYSFAGIAIAGINRNDNKTSMFTHESNSEALFYSYINYTSSSLPPVFMFLRNGKIDNAIKRDNPDINLNSKFSYIRKPGKNYMAIYQKLNPILVDTVNIDNNPDRLFPYFPNPDKFMSIYLSDNGLLDIMKLSPYTSGQVPVIKTAPLTQKSVFSSLNSFIKNFFKGKKNKSEHLVKLNYQMGNYIDKQIISPILDTTSWKNPNLLTQLNIISVAAKIANLSITLHIIPDQKENKFVSLKPADTNYENELFLFNAANYSPYIIIEEPPSTGESLSLAVFIAQQLNARALFIPDSIIKDKSAVFTEAQTNYEYKKTLLYLVAQVTIRKMDQYYREHNKKVPDNCITNNIIQFRSIESEALNSTSENTVFISTNTGAYNLGLLTPDQLKVYRLLKKVGLKVAFVDGRKQTAGMEACNLLTYNYLSETSNTNFMVIWFPSKMVLKF